MVFIPNNSLILSLIFLKESLLKISIKEKLGKEGIILFDVEEVLLILLIFPEIIAVSLSTLLIISLIPFKESLR